MLTDTMNDSTMPTPEGELVRVIFISQIGFEDEVVTPEYFASKTGYSVKHIIRMCDEDKLIAYKIRGMVWVEKSQLENMRQVS